MHLTVPACRIVRFVPVIGSDTKSFDLYWYLRIDTYIPITKYINENMRVTHQIRQICKHLVPHECKRLFGLKCVAFFVFVVLPSSQVGCNQLPKHETILVRGLSWTFALVAVLLCLRYFWAAMSIFGVDGMTCSAESHTSNMLDTGSCIHADDSVSQQGSPSGGRVCCHLCLGPPPFAKQYYGIQLHSDCWSGVRAKQLFLKNSDESVSHPHLTDPRELEFSIGVQICTTQVTF